MQPVPIVLSTDLTQSIRFWEALGYEVDTGTRTTTWAAMMRDGHVVGLHTAEAALPDADGPSRFWLNLIADEPLEKVRARFQEAGITVDRDIADETFGRSLQVRDPDGTWIWVVEYDDTLRR